jgi:hypothetical protein
MKTLILSLLAVTAVGNLALPAFSDEVNLQSVQQVTTQEGNMNTSYQKNQQKIQSSRGSRQVLSDLGNVQDAYQDTLQEGEGNLTRQTNVQKIKVRNNSRSYR